MSYNNLDSCIKILAEFTQRLNNHNFSYNGQKTNKKTKKINEKLLKLRRKLMILNIKKIIFEKCTIESCRCRELFGHFNKTEQDEILEEIEIVERELRLETGDEDSDEIEFI